MDREQTPLKQRQKRTPSERAFRSSSSGAQRGRAAAAPSVILAKPPLTILRAAPPSPPSASPLHPPLHPPSSSQRCAALRVITAAPPPPPPPPTAAASASSPMASAVGTPHALRKPAASAGQAPPPPPPPMLLRASSASSSPLVAAPPAATKLITSGFQFASDIPTRLASCLELSHFTVVGAFGVEGVGKSTLLTTLAKLAFASATSTSWDGGMPALRDRAANAHFLAQRLETQLGVRQETQGVDLAVACEAPRLRAALGGLVLLDAQPLRSASHLADVLARNDSTSAARFGALSPEQQSELASVQLAILLLSVCHYVLVPQLDLEMVAFLRKVHDKMQHCRLPNVSGHVVKDKHVAQLLFVANDDGVAMTATTATTATAPRSLTRLLPPEWLYRSPDHGNALPLWRFPRLAADAPPRVVDEWRAHALRWARFVASLPASPSFTKVAAPALTLKEWLSNTARVWESVKRSSALTEEYAARDHY